MDVRVNNTKPAYIFLIFKNVTLLLFLCVLGRSFMWPMVRESFHENGIQPQPDPMEGIGDQMHDTDDVVD